jgi:uncharacterized membrane protein YebE (DUF533 family)
MRGKDPGFNLQQIEDRVSVIFYRWMTALRRGDIAPIRKMATDRFCGELANWDEMKSDRAGRRHFPADSAVGSVSVTAAVPGREHDRVLVRVKWEAQPSVAIGSKQEEADSPRRRRESNFLLLRASTARTDLSRTLTSAHCPSCGAPQTDVSADACEYCETVLNTGQHDWVLEEIQRRNIYEKRREMQRTARQADAEVESAKQKAGLPAAAAVLAPGVIAAPSTPVEMLSPADAVEAIIALAFSDGVIDRREEKMLDAFAAARFVSREKLEILRENVRSSPPPARTEAENDALFRRVCALALADGRIKGAERKAIFQAGRYLQFDKARISRTLRQEARRLTGSE